MKGFRQHWVGPLVTTAVAAMIGLVSRTIVLEYLAAFGLTIGAAVCLCLVAANSYRSGRDPSRLFVAAGAGGLAIGWLTFFVTTALIDASTTPATEGVTALSAYAGPIGTSILAGCLLFVVPWRDRRGRPPLRVPTVLVPTVLVELALLVIAYVFTPSSSGDVVRGLFVLTGLLAAVAAVRSIARGGWNQWVGGAAFAVTVASWGVLPLFGDPGGSLAYVAAFAWYLFLPGVAGILVLVGVLNAQRAESSRLRRASDRATEVMEGRAEIASIVAHDVRGPAGTIRSVAGSLRTSYDRLDDPQRLEFVRMIEQESLRLLRIADQMSLGLKTDAGTLEFTRVLRDVEGPVLQGLHDADVGDRAVEVTADGSVRAAIDARWIAEAARQGLENGLKFSSSDTPISLRVGHDDAWASIEIEDRGPGVPAEMRELVFEKFCRWRPAGYEDQPGSGLGLFIVRSIAREHGGDALITDGPQGGTILQIHVPLEGAT